MKNNATGVLLTNIGSPDHPTASSVRQYLKKFLSDKRIVAIPRILWWPILHGFILRTRPEKSAQLYQKIWDGKNSPSPLVLFSQNLAKKLAVALQMPVELGTHYGNPSIPDGLQKLRKQNLKKIIILPLYPQYSATTTASTFDFVTDELKKWRALPEIQFLHHYSDNKNYIDALCHTIQKFSVKHLVFSFHGIPKYCVDKGDPYFEECLKTVALVTEQLNFSKNNYTVAFQSRLGRAEWLSPYTEKVLQTLPTQGIHNIHVICPGFAVDCLETLEEIALRGKTQFLKAGGEHFHYIPALNDSDEHVFILQKIIENCSLA